VNDSLKAGLSIELEYTVTDEMAPAHIPAKILSTPSMVGLIERTCFACTRPHLDPNETTVGTHVCVSHSGPARSGEKVQVRVTLSGIAKRRLSFDTVVIAAAGTISTGTHERAVVDLDRMRQRSENTAR
jgi:fluoroacetyl-CoA thioesterase